MLSLLTKLCVSSGILTGVFIVDFSSVNFLKTKQKEQEAKNLEKIKTSLTTIRTLDEIELFEKAHGCSFNFVGSWDNKKTYKFKKFLEEQKGPGWDSKVIQGANTFQSNCKNKKTVALFYSQGTKRFGLNSNQLPQ